LKRDAGSKLAKWQEQTKYESIRQFEATSEIQTKLLRKYDQPAS